LGHDMAGMIEIRRDLIVDDRERGGKLCLREME
jgi:hypothetical protein